MNHGAISVIYLALSAVCLIGLYSIYTPSINTAADTAFGHVRTFVDSGFKGVGSNEQDVYILGYNTTDGFHGKTGNVSIGYVKSIMNGYNVHSFSSDMNNSPISLKPGARGYLFLRGAKPKPATYNNHVHDELGVSVPDSYGKPNSDVGDVTYPGKGVIVDPDFSLGIQGSLQPDHQCVETTTSGLLGLMTHGMNVCKKEFSAGFYGGKNFNIILYKEPNGHYYITNNTRGPQSTDYGDKDGGISSSEAIAVLHENQSNPDDISTAQIQRVNQ